MSWEFGHFESDVCDVALLPGKRGIYHWLCKTPVYWWDTDGELHGVPVNRISDGYSVPAILWSLIRGLKSMLPAYAHDEAYLLACMSRSQADANLRAGIVATGGSWWTAWKVWAGVRLGGWIAWNRYARLRKKYSQVAIESQHTAETLQEAREKAKQGLSEALP